MSIRALTRVFYVTTGVLASLLAVFAVLLFSGQHEVKLATSLRYASYLLADELRQSSDDLTRMARTYVVTGDDRFERMYWQILAIRNGEARRPPDYERIYWDLVAAEPGFEAGDREAGPSLRARMQQLGFLRHVERVRLQPRTGISVSSSRRHEPPYPGPTLRRGSPRLWPPVPVFFRCVLRRYDRARSLRA